MMRLARKGESESASTSTGSTVVLSMKAVAKTQAAVSTVHSEKFRR
ncbi:MAG TPA: hypothetical protein PK794_01740 [Armatimonadota bacterium]|nr:hypothetical protein [Armatimonadota bacterium]